MRKISKGDPHEAIKKFEGQQEWSVSVDYHRIWREHILGTEQYGLSGYTEAPLHMDDSHIDHFYKRSLFRDKVHSWENLVVDTIDETYGAKYKDKLVKIAPDNLKVINPVTENPRQFFKYKVDGRIAPLDELSENDRERAEYTIKTFNLNEASLVDRRKTVLVLYDSYGDASLEQLLEWLKTYGFPSVIEQMYNERKHYDDKEK